MLKLDSIGWLVALGCLAGLSGCGANAPDGEAVEAASDAVIGGSPISVATRRALGLIDVSTSIGECSGSLLSPDWVLTASHCIDYSNPGANTFSAPRPNGGTDLRVAVTTTQVNGTDVAIIKLSPILAGMLWPNVSRSVSSADPNDLISQNITCYGRGATAYASPSGVTGSSWRALTRQVIFTSTANLVIGADSNGREILAPGDSGGACFFNGQAVGVDSRGSWECADDSNAVSCKNTITKIKTSSLATVGPNAAFINAAPLMKPVYFQANTHDLWVDDGGSGANTGLGMLAHTVPSWAFLPGGGQVVAFQANTGNLWLDVNGSATDHHFGMKPGTSPSVVVAPNGQILTAFQANTGNLWLDVSGSGGDQGLGMMAGTSPSITVLSNGLLATAFQANTGNLWLEVNGVGSDQSLGMKSGTSPSIASLPNGQVVTAFQANTGKLWLDVNGVGTDQNRAMMPGTSPSIAVLSNGQIAVAYQGSNGSLAVQVNGVATDLQLSVMPTASPTIVALPNAGWQISVEAANGNLWLNINGVNAEQQLGMSTP